MPTDSSSSWAQYGALNEFFNINLNQVTNCFIYTLLHLQFVVNVADCVDSRKKKRKKEKGQPTTASWAQPFISQQINMASADCLHMAPCRRASPHFLISQQRINVLLTENIVLHQSSTCGLDSDTPTASSRWPPPSVEHRATTGAPCLLSLCAILNISLDKQQQNNGTVCTKRIIAVKELSQQLCFLVPG